MTYVTFGRATIKKKGVGELVEIDSTIGATAIHTPRKALGEGFSSASDLCSPRIDKDLPAARVVRQR